MRRQHAGGWREVWPLLSGMLLVAVLGGLSDKVPVGIGRPPGNWLLFLWVVMLAGLPFLGAVAGTRTDGPRAWLWTVWLALPCWIGSVVLAFDLCNRKLDTGQGHWVTASVSLCSRSRAGYLALGRLDKEPATEIHFGTRRALAPGDRVWIKLHPGALGMPWGSAWQTTPPE